MCNLNTTYVFVLIEVISAISYNFAENHRQLFDAKNYCFLIKYSVNMSFRRFEILTKISIYPSLNLLFNLTTIIRAI